MRKLAAASTGFVFQETLNVHHAYKQSAPNNSLTIHRAISRLEPVVSGWSQLYLADLEWSTDALWHNSGLRPWGPIERWLYTATWLRARTQWPRDALPAGPEVESGQKRPHLGTPDPIWEKCSKSGQSFSRIGQKKLIHKVMLHRICVAYGDIHH